MADQSQSYQTHARYVPGYHFVLSGMLAVNLVWTIRNLIKTPATDAAITVMMAVGLILMYWYMRAFAVRVQDRVIRLEEMLRMERVLPPDLRPRTSEFDVRQLVAMRFASDDELPQLARKVLDEKLGQKAIKQAVKDWRPDHLRA